MIIKGGKVPALGTKKAVSLSNRDGFSVIGSKNLPKDLPKIGTNKFFRNMGPQLKDKESKIVRAKREWLIALPFLRPMVKILKDLNCQGNKLSIRI